VAAAVILSVVIVAITPMKGKLAYFTLFFILWMLIDSLIVRNVKVQKVYETLLFQR